MPAGHRYASVCIEISHEKVDRPFQYRIPEKLRDSVYPGVLVKIPFGRGNKLINGYVMEVTDESAFDDEKTKEIESVSEDGINAEGRMIALAAWMRRHYGSTMIAALKSVLPVRSRVKSIVTKELKLAVSEDKRKELLNEAERKHHVAKVRLFEAFEDADALSYPFVTGKLGVSAQTISSLEKQGAIEINEYRTYRDPVKIRESSAPRVRLNDEQKTALDVFSKDYDEGVRKAYLLYGVTGSGKTEVYMEMIQKVLNDGKQAIVLIPEIALTYQTVLRFYRRFGNIVSVIHSRLSEGERFDQFERAKKGEIKIMIGPRSALFTPFDDIGLIVMDEEGESSYKSDRPPKYHARETAEEVARMHKASLVLGSATPSITSFSRALSGEYKLLTLTSRYSDSGLPDVEVVDLKDELKAGNRSIFSRSLKKKLEETVRAGNQAMLFINRRGYAGFISCRSCGYVARCPHCDVSLTEHGKKRLVCHYCGYEEKRPEKCPECGSPYIAGFSAGTEQIEEKLKELIPGVRVLRMDADTTSKKGDHEKILSAFAEGNADVLVGTQMIVKGHDFPNVSLVGIIAADMSLFVGDYMAAERTFSLLTQAIGRAGRGEKKGTAVLQTYRPDHYAVECASRQDYEGFFKEEYAYRKMCSYPPVSHMLAILMSCADKGKLYELAGGIKKICMSAADIEMTKVSGDAGTRKRISVIGPADALISRINDVFRKVVYIRSADEEDLIGIKEKTEEYLDGLRKEGDKAYAVTTVTFDFDPINAY